MEISYKKALEKELTKKVKSFYSYENDYLRAFTVWVSSYMQLDTFPSFLFKEDGVLTEVACGSCLRCLLKYQVFENLSEISYDVSTSTNTIFPVTILEELVQDSEQVFDSIEGE